MKQQITDILIIGAGPSGMVAAGYLNQKDVSIKVVEKQKFPRFSIGESLIPRCMDNFEEAGLLEVIREQGYQKKYGARFIREYETAEFDFSEKYGAGWDWTWQVPRADFDKVLADHLTALGVDISFETSLGSIKRKNDLWEVEVCNPKGESQIIYSKFIIDSSGNGRVLASRLGLEAEPKVDGHGSIFTHIVETERPLGKEGNLISFEVLDSKKWFWYIPFSNGTSSLGFVGPDDWFQQFQGSTEEVFRKMLAQTKYFSGRFDNYKFEFRPVQLRNIARNVNTTHGKGFALTGNSAEFLDPVFSSGVAFATESGLLAAKLAYRELKGVQVNWKIDYEDHIKQGVDVFATYVKEWYTGKLQDIIFHPDPDSRIRKQICSILAGYVWDKSNPFIRNHHRIIDNLHSLILSEKSE